MRREGIAVIVVMGLIVAALELAHPVGAAAAKAAASDVNVVNTPTVNVVNTPTDAVPVYQALAPTQVFRMNFNGSLPATQSGGYSSQIFTVPADTLLIIEMVSGYASLPTGQIPFLYITSHRNVPTEHFNYSVPLTNLGAEPTNNFYQGTSLVRIYAEAGEAVFLSFARAAGISGEVSFLATVSGYLVPLPTP